MMAITILLTMMSLMRLSDSAKRKRLAVALQILNGSSVHAWPNIFVLGTHGARVNFTSQQIRAMNLIWALLEKKSIKVGQKVCVVGAGLSGLTAAASLVERGYEVALFDKNMDVLFEQHHTHHRFIHPSINFWPEGVINPSTNFPFFDWFAGPCSEVVKKITADWEKHFSHGVQRFFGKEVVGFNKDGNQIKLQYLSKTGEILSDPYDVVILALGFGHEKHIDGFQTRSYWHSDNLEIERQSTEFSETVVCGIGDGALIDLFRLAFNKSFDLGRLIALFANRVAIHRITLDLAEAERNARQVSAEAASLKLSEAYRRAIRALDKDVLFVLESAIQREMRDRLTLIGPYPSAYSVQAAPIHKLVLAFLEFKEFFRYVRGKAVRIDDGVVDIKAPDEVSKRRHGYPVVRVGSEHGITKFADVFDLGPLIAAQKILAESNLISQWEPKNFYLTSGETTKDRTDPRFIADRARLANKRIGDLYHGIENIAVTMTAKGTRTLVAELRPNLSIHQVNNMPTNLFGIKLTVDSSKRMIAI